MDERTAQAVRSVLEQTNSRWNERLKAQIDAVVREVASHLDVDVVSGRYAITDVELRGIIARAVSRAGGQTAVDIGQALDQMPRTSQFAISLQNDKNTNGRSGLDSELQQEF
jgi:hypothetical protein